MTWLQGPTGFVDLRQQPTLADTTEVSFLRALTLAQVLELAEQEGFAGTLIHHPDSSFEWQRQIDFQPKAGRADRGFLDHVGSMMIETGYAEPYLEHWHRSGETNAPPSALGLKNLSSGRPALIVRVGRDFMFARDRASDLREAHLRDHVAGAASLEIAQDMVDCEISLGGLNDDGWRIQRSTLPYRVGRLLAPRIGPDDLETADVDPWGCPCVRRWAITFRDGDFAAE